MDKAYWENISGNYNSEIFDVRKSDKSGIITSWIKEISSSKKTIGDVGCGIGKWLPLLSKQFGKVYAIDISSNNLDYCEKKFKQLKNISYLNTDMSLRMKEMYSFDAILCVNAILTESLVKRTTFFKNISANLKPEGNLILVVPSLESVLYSAFVLDNYNRKRGFPNKKFKEVKNKNEYFKFRQRGIVNIDKVPTKHYLREELISTLTESGFNEITIGKVEYSWNSEIDNAPKSLKGPYPWDWVVKATKRKS